MSVTAAVTKQAVAGAGRTRDQASAAVLLL